MKKTNVPDKMYNIIENLINVYTDIIDIYILRYIYRFILINDKKQKNKFLPY